MFKKKKAKKRTIKITTRNRLLPEQFDRKEKLLVLDKIAQFKQNDDGCLGDVIARP